MGNWFSNLLSNANVPEHIKKKLNNYMIQQKRSPTQINTFIKQFNKKLESITVNLSSNINTSFRNNNQKKPLLYKLTAKNKMINHGIKNFDNTTSRHLSKFASNKISKMKKQYKEYHTFYRKPNKIYNFTKTEKEWIAERKLLVDYFNNLTSELEQSAIIKALNDLNSDNINNTPLKKRLVDLIETLKKQNL